MSDSSSASELKRQAERWAGLPSGTRARLEASLKQQLAHDGVEYVPEPTVEDLQREHDEAVAARAAQLLKEQGG